MTDSELGHSPRAYRDREKGTTVSISEGPTGLVVRQVSVGGLLAESVESHRDDPGPGLRTGYTYDAFGRRTAIDDPCCGESTTEYDPATGRVVASLDPEGRKTAYEYYPADHKSAGRLARTINPDGKAIHVAYDGRGQQTATWGPATQPLVYRYDDYGQMVGMTTYQTLPNGDPSLEPVAGTETKWHYHEPTGTLEKKEYADGHGPTYAYTEDGRLRQRTWARRGDIPVAQAASESPTTDQPGNLDTENFKLETVYTHDPLTSALARTDYSDGTAISYEYDDAGRLRKVTDPTGTREFRYDSQNRVTSEIVTVSAELVGADGPSARPPGPATASPDLASPIPNSASLHYRINRTYTALGQPAGVALRDLNAAPGEGLQHDVTYQWNDHGQLSGVASPAGEWTYAYDEKNPALLRTLVGPVLATATTYEPHRDLIASVENRVLGGESRKEKEEGSENPAADAAQAILSPGSSLLSSYHYTNDLLGRRTAIAQGGSAFAMLRQGDHLVEVAYNDRSEVVGATRRAEDAAPFHAETYAYDGIGNRTSHGSRANGHEENATYTTNALNQYEKISVDQRPSAVSPAHDLDGNLLEDDTHRFTWNGENRLVRVESKDDLRRVDYAYDYQGRRTVKRTYFRAKATENWKLNTEKLFLYDGWNLLAEVETSGPYPATSESDTKIQDPRSKIADSVRYHTWGRDLSGSLQGAGGVGGLLAITTTTEPASATDAGDPISNIPHPRSETKFPSYDANGNIVQLVDGGGEVAASYAYDAFGTVIASAGDAAHENPWRFSTKPVEEETGWLYYGFRYYMPETGRWASRDPIGEQGGVNLYGFVGNDGAGRIDFLGLVEVTSELPVPRDIEPHMYEGNALNGGSYTYFPLCNVKCNCACSDQKWRASDCFVWVIARIAIDVAQAQRSGASVDEVLGHEQQHVRSRNSKINTLINEIREYGDQQSYSDSEACSDSVSRKYADKLSQLLDARKSPDHTHIGTGANRRPNPSATIFSPASGVGSPTQPGTLPSQFRPMGGRPSLERPACGTSDS